MHLLSRLRRHSLVLLLSALPLAGAAVVAHAEPARAEVAKQVKAYASADGVKVSTLRYGPREREQALIQVIDVDNAIDGKIMLASTRTTDKDTRYTVQLNGRPYVLLIVSEAAGELYVPGAPKPTWVSYNADLSAQSNPEHYLTDYEEQGKGK
jgi:DNA-binding LacI/PurR family transcriptional regulator